jgi:very-short-patch-repair endonuclease
MNSRQDPERDFAVRVRTLKTLGRSSRTTGATAPYWGIRTAADPGEDQTLRALAFAPRLPDRAFYFGVTAAAIHGLPLPMRVGAQPTIHAAVRSGDRRIQAAGVTPHHIRVRDSDITTVRGLPVTTPARTWCDLATAGITLAELVAAGDRAIWRRAPRTSRDQLRLATANYEGRRGAAIMRIALPLLSDRADSPAESALRVAIVAAGFAVPDVNGEVRVGGRVLHLDLSWPDRLVAIEYEGDHHRTDRDQWRLDIQRFTELQEAGWFVYRATADDLRDLGRLLVWLSHRVERVRV